MNDVIIVFLVISTPIIVVGLVYYLKKRFEHKQIMLALEKGTPLSELRPVEPATSPGPLWIKNLTAGIAMLIIAVGLIYMLYLGCGGPPQFVYLLVAVILFAVGASRLIRGLLQRKTEQQTLSGNNGAGDIPGQSSV
jgi:uncharacterized membrane protein YbhN (UPF0104 family)